MFKRIYVEITNICNLNCSFCKKDNRDKQFMSVSDFKLIIDKVKNYTNNIYLHIKGEPLMHPNIKEIIEICNENDINVNITTNGRVLNSSLDIINNTNIRQINISLHSYSNIDEIKELLDTIDQINNTYISLRLWNDKDNTKVLNLLNTHYNVQINNKRMKLKDNIFISLDTLFEWPDINLDIIHEQGTCLGLRHQLGILVDGTVVPCCLDQDANINLGNIFNETLESILSKQKCKAIIEGFRNRKLIEPLCKRCGYIKRFNKHM